MLFLSRRSSLISLMLPTFFTGIHQKDDDLNISISTSIRTDSEDVKQIASLICQATPISFRSAIAETGQFLYRGENQEPSTIVLQQPPPDLLLPETYNDDPHALEYFECLEERLGGDWNPNLPVVAKPSTGHIATSDPVEAAKWGMAVSVWPLGTQWSFVTPRHRPVFYPNDTKQKKSPCYQDDLFLDAGLSWAFRQSREVLFATDGIIPSNLRPSLPGKPKLLQMSSFLTIPQEFDSALQSALENLRYGLKST